MAFRRFKPENKKGIGQAFESNGQVIGSAISTKPFPFNPALENRWRGFQKATIPIPDLTIQARHDVEARSTGLCKIEADHRGVVAEDLALGPDVVSQLFNLVLSSSMAMVIASWNLSDFSSTRAL